MKRLMWVSILIEFVKNNESANHCYFAFLRLVASFRFYLLEKKGISASETTHPTTEINCNSHCEYFLSMLLSESSENKSAEMQRL